MKNIPIIVLILFLLFNFTAYTLAQPDGAEAYILELIEKNEIPGLAVAVSKKGKIVWAEGFGYAVIEHEIPVDPFKTKFRIGSVSKPLTSAGLGVLMQRGAIDIDAPVQNYVPYFPKKKFPISSRQLAGHIAGIRGYKRGENLSAKRYKSVQDGIEIFMNDSLLFEPGSKFAYSSYGFNLLSAVIEGASERSFLEFMEQEVFEPLEMHATVADWTDSLIMHRATGYGMDRGKIINAPYVDNSYKWAGGGFLSSASDLIKFGNACLTDALFSDSIKQILIRPQHTSEGKSTGYGMGWYTDSTDTGIPKYAHDGGAIGFRSLLAIYPEHELVVVILTNDTRVNFQGNEAFAELFME